MSKKNIDVVITALTRPELIQIALGSFRTLLNNYNVRLIINVDPIGNDKNSQEDIIKICKLEFKDVIYRAPKKPNFSKAVYWCWKQIKSDIFFHLEEDWCLKKEIDATLINEYFRDPQVVSVSLNMKSNKKYIQNTKKNSDPSSEFYIGLALRPTFFRSSYIKELLKNFNLNLDPEKQFSRNTITKSYKKPIFKYYGNKSEGNMISDTGKYWREKNKFEKWNATSNKITYKQKKMNGYLQLYYSIKYYFLIKYWNIRYCKK